MQFLRVCLVPLLLVACDPSPGMPRRDGGNVPDIPGFDGGPPTGPCDATMDADGDGIADALEGDSDIDGDGTPARLDDDSDGDGYLDSEEAGATPCAALDSDGDGIIDSLDLDSDNDGLVDAMERAAGSSPRNPDTDGDGAPDIVEVAAGTDPTNNADTIPEEDFFVVLPYMDPQQDRPLRFGTSIRQADVYFLVDTTASMSLAIANVNESLTRIAAEVTMRIPDVHIGVGDFRDYPFTSFLVTPPVLYGSMGDYPYSHRIDVTGDLPAVQAQLGMLGLGSGADAPESLVPALYLIATGAAGSWTFGAPPVTMTSTIAAASCPGGGRGYPCFRDGSLPIIVAVTDAVSHNGVGFPYADISPPPPDLLETQTALGAIGARFIGIAVGGGGRPDLESLATSTGTIGGDGLPLVIDAPSGEVSNGIVDGIAAIADNVRQDVTTDVTNVPGNPDDFDAALFVQAIVPFEGYGAEGAGTGYERKDETTFYGVVPGTEVEFTVEFINTVRPGAAEPQVFQAEIGVLGNGVTRLDSRRVYILVPPTGGEIVLI